ncbi:LON peptidase substrate-binding domain-containing protein [Marichromatium sp. AB31]|uniref:LON peptidase substrate-binding domain-containing protein n=1 Tax=Marichromatium sp. AB31 TaxID=2483362 RepID=UPI000F3F9247|nr:LON peptidase substrate-binding domain-containing protein [Marichromatium sp. AB31]RNE89351.1 peptidase S16 [Marichromatium sp. AB31]
MTRTPFFPKFADLPTELAVFPLPGAVLMPGVQLPLNIFEPRYLRMINDVLAADHLLGMIQPQETPGEDETPTPAPLHPVGCAGRITSYSETSDGRIVLVLTGVCRFRVTGELAERAGYRRVAPEWRDFAADLDEPASGAIAERRPFLVALERYCQVRRVEVPWQDLEQMPDTDLVNLLCAHLPLSPEDKQALIETLETPARAVLMRGLLEMATIADIDVDDQRH